MMIDSLFTQRCSYSGNSEHRYTYYTFTGLEAQDIFSES